MKTGGSWLWAVLVSGIAAGALAGCGGQHVQRGQVTVAPASSLLDQPVHIVVGGVGSERNVVVELRSVDAKGTEFTSRATFRSNRSGRVDLATTGATAGEPTPTRRVGVRRL
ncbi:MAG: acyl-CoA thioesterase/BAAT N-terminal domain-containing protein [Solirubrobacteraceae bacterium]